MIVREPADREAGGFEARLLPMLLEAVEERKSGVARGRTSSSRVPRRALVAGLTAAALVVATAVMVVGRSSIEVRAADALEDSELVVAELRDAGIEARILAVPVGRAMVGTWWHLYFAPGVKIDGLTWAKLKAQVGVGVAGLPEEILDGGRGVYHSEVLELPRNLPGSLTLVVGRQAGPGESEAPMDNELAPNGAFWCQRLDRMHPARAGEMLQSLGYEVVWVHDTFQTPGGESQVVEVPPSDSGITTAWFRTPSVIHVGVAPAAHVDRLRRSAGTPTNGVSPPGWAPACS